MPIALVYILGVMTGLLTDFLRGYFQIRAEELNYQATKYEIESRQARDDLDKFRELSQEFLIQTHAMFEKTAASPQGVAPTEFQAMRDSAYTMLAYFPQLGSMSVSMYSALYSLATTPIEQRTQDQASRLTDAYNAWFPAFGENAVLYEQAEMPLELTGPFIDDLIRDFMGREN